MEAVSQALYKAMRDDTEITNGLRYLLGNPDREPYNCYHAFLPESVEFTPTSGLAQSFITYFMVSAAGNPETQRESTIEELVYNVSVYARSLATLESIQRRIKLRLHRMRNITQPSSLAVINQLLYESRNAVRWDEAFRVHWQTSFYRVWFRDDNLG